MPPVEPLYLQHLGAFQRGEVGASLRRARLADKTREQVHQRLVAIGFHHRRMPMLAERGAQGEPRFRLVDGGSTDNPRDARVVIVDVYLHLDGGLVRVYPLGDPRRRVVPESGTPWAVKTVLFQAPAFRQDEATQQRYLHADTSFLNEAFCVTDDGHPVPKSRRAIYGINFDPQQLLDSWRFAEEVIAETRIRLAPPPPPAPSPSGAPPAPPRLS